MLHRTAPKLLTLPTPAIAPAIVGVVEIGVPIANTAAGDPQAADAASPAGHHGLADAI